MSDNRRRTELTRRAVLGGAIAAGTGLAIGRPLAAAAAQNAARDTVLDHTATVRAGSGVTSTVGYDQYSLFLNGERLFVWSGEFHPFRLPAPELWPDILQKMKASGFNAVCTYFNWSYHSPAPGTYDFTGVRDMDSYLAMAADAGLYVLARPGPYINAEVNAGGFPGWLTMVKDRARYDTPGYLAAADEWLTAINAIIARHQVTDGGGTVLLYQIENEYAVTDSGGQDYMGHLLAKARADGITVPVYHNDKGRDGDWVPGSFPGSGKNYLYGFDGYPSPTSTPPDWGYYGSGGQTGGSTASPGTPGFEAEFGGGWFDPWGDAPWGGQGYPYERALAGPAYERRFYLTNIANGIKIHNTYMVFGGTSWGWLPAPVVYTSYDYGAAITEARQLTGKAAALKQIGYFLQAVPDVAKLGKAAPPDVSNGALASYHLANPDTGTELYLLRNDHTTAQDTTLSVRGHTPSLTVAAEDAKLVLANWPLAGGTLVYTTSHLMTTAPGLAVLTGPRGDQGETALHYPERISVSGPSVTSAYDSSTGDTVISYPHDGLTTATVTEAGGRALTLIIADDDTAATLWRGDLPGGEAAIVAGPALLRSAARDGAVLRLAGDTAAPSTLRVWPPAGIRETLWNGRPVPAGGAVPGPPAVTLPALSEWRYADENPEAAPGFDDRDWTTVPSGGSLYIDGYGFHYGDVWYRGTWTGEPGGQVSIAWSGGTVGCVQAWLDGTYLGFSQLPTPTASQSTTAWWSQTATFDVPSPARGSGKHVLAALARTMSHAEDGSSNDAFKAGLGLSGVSFPDASGAPSLQWKITGAEPGTDPVRGPMNTGGLYGERGGWHLPAFNDSAWQTVTLPHASGHAGVAWYRTRFTLSIPEGVDASLGLSISDDHSKRYRALIFLNGWNVGQYVNDVGPQTTFVLPAGVLDPRGANTLALAVTGASACDLGAVSLVSLGTAAGGVATP